MKKIISVAGTLGVGKSTLTKLLAKELGYTAIYESPEKNPFLPQFYKQMNRWAFHSQTFFLTEKINLLMQIRQSKMDIVQDTPIYEDVYSYAKTQYVSGYMDKNEWNLYKKMYELLEDRLSKPSLIIYLYAPIPIIYERIKIRDRSYEAVTKKLEFIKYLTVLETLNQKWIKAFQKKIKIITIDTVKINYLQNNEDKKTLFQIVRKFI